ncbi:hypothetical protein EC957_005392, partial [Mortierella hygrophila]
MTSTAHPLTLLTLPTEVLDRVLPFLSQHDLTRCVCVSQAWNKAFVSHFWRTLDFRSHHSLKQFLTSETQQALIKNAKFVRELAIVHKKLYHQFLPSRQTITEEPGVSRSGVFAMGLFANLRTLELHYLRQPEDDHDQRIYALVRQNPSLVRLKIDVAMDPTALMSLITKHLPNLRDLDLSFTCHGDVKFLLENLPECIRA